MHTDVKTGTATSNQSSNLDFSIIDMGLFENVRICRDDDFQSLVSRAAETSGCEFLFEIPAAMIGENGKMAAAMRLEADDSDTYCFVVVCRTSGSIELIKESAVSEALIDFVRSYASVLTHLADTEQQDTAIH